MDQVQFKRKKFSLLGFSALNLLAGYSLFLEPLLQATMFSFYVNPVLFFPGVIANYYMMKRSYIWFFKDQIVVNMYLQPQQSSGQEQRMFVETLDGDLKKLRINSIYKIKEVKKRGMIERVDMLYGANKRLSLVDGYHKYFDMEILNILIKGNSVDT